MPAEQAFGNAREKSGADLELSRDRLGCGVHYLSPLFQKNKSTFPKLHACLYYRDYTSSPICWQASIEPASGLAVSIMLTNCLRAHTPCLLCAHPPLQAVRKAQTNIYRATVGWAWMHPHLRLSGQGKGRKGHLLSAGVGEGDPYMVSERYPQSLSITHSMD